MRLSEFSSPKQYSRNSIPPISQSFPSLLGNMARIQKKEGFIRSLLTAMTQVLPSLIAAAEKRGLWEGVVQEPLRRALFFVCFSGF